MLLASHHASQANPGTEAAIGRMCTAVVQTGCETLTLHPYLEQVYVTDGMVLHQLTHSCDRADTIFSVCKEQFWHHLSLQVHLLLHMAGRIARHVGGKNGFAAPPTQPPLLLGSPKPEMPGSKTGSKLFLPRGAQTSMQSGLHTQCSCAQQVAAKVQL